MSESHTPGSKHFVLQALADGVSAAIAIDGGSAICNAGLIDLGSQLLAFDAFLTPQAAMDLRQKVVEIYGRPPQIVIDSHYHNDHIWGNQVFTADAQIISSTRTRELIATAGMEEYQWNKANAAQRLGSMRTQYQNTNDAQQQADLSLWIGEYEGIVEAMPDLKVCLPGITFDKYLKLYGTKYTAELITFEGGHTESDTILYLPQTGIVFMSDLLFTGFHPYLADGSPLNLLKALREISQLNAAWYVPGHGPVGTIEDIKLLTAYIEHCFETAQRLVEIGKVNEDTINALKIPAMFQHWRMSQFYRTNIRFICERVSSAKDEKQIL